MATTAHGTLVADTVSTVTVTGQFEFLELVNRDVTSTIYYRFDGTSPTVGGGDAFVLPPMSVDTVNFEGAASGGKTVKLISSGTPAYSVQGRS